MFSYISDRLQFLVTDCSAGCCWLFNLLILLFILRLSGPAPVFRAGTMGVELPSAVLLLPGPGVCRAPSPHHRALLLPPGEAQTQLPGAPTHLPLRRSLQVSSVAFSSHSDVTCWLLHSLSQKTFQLDASCFADDYPARGGTNQWNQLLKCLIGKKSRRLLGVWLITTGFKG